MRTSAVFHVENDDPEIMIQPRKGRIQGDQKCIFTVSFFSSIPKTFESEIVMNIRGGKQLRLPIKAQSIVPEIFIEEKAVDFGGVTFGD